MKKVSIITLLILQLVICAVNIVMAKTSLTDKDYVIASLNLDDSIEKVKKVLGNIEYVESYKNEISGTKVNVYKTSGLKLQISFYQKSSYLWTIELTSSKYSTARGLKVGDSKQTILDKYGKPGYSDTYQNNGKNYLLWDYEDTDTMRAILFRINTATNKIETITIAKIID